MFMYTNSGQNKLKVIEKEKKLTSIYTKEIYLVARQFTYTCSNNKGFL